MNVYYNKNVQKIQSDKKLENVFLHLWVVVYCIRKPVIGRWAVTGNYLSHFS